MSSENRRPKLAHVARIAGVSVSTASLALRGQGRVSAATAARVREAADKLGYRVDVTARSLRSGDSGQTVGVIIDPSVLLGSAGVENIPATFWYRLFYHLTARLAEDNVRLVQVTTESQHALLSLPLAAVFVVSYSDPRPEIVDFGYPIPMITLGKPIPGDDPRIRAYCDYDTAALTRIALDGLAKSGATRVVLVDADSPDISATISRQAYADWCRAHDQEQKLLIADTENPDIAEDVRAAAEAGWDGFYLRVPLSGSAVRGITDAGLRIPDDVRVVAHSEGVFEASMSPTISTISPLAHECSDQLAALMLRVIAGAEKDSLMVDFRLIDRESTGNLDRPNLP